MKKFTKIILMTTLMMAPTFSATLPGMNIEGELEVEANTTTKVTGDLHVYGSITGSGTLDFTENQDKKIYLHAGKNLTEASDTIKTAIQAYHDEHLADQPLGNIYMNEWYEGTIDDTVTIKKGATSKTYAELKASPDNNLINCNYASGSNLTILDDIFGAKASDVVHPAIEGYDVTFHGGDSSDNVKTINFMLSDISLGNTFRIRLLDYINLSGKADYLTGNARIAIGNSTEVGGGAHVTGHVSITSPDALPKNSLNLINGSLTFRNGAYKTAGDITLLKQGDSHPELVVEEGSSLTISKGTKLKIEYSNAG